MITMISDNNNYNDYIDKNVLATHMPARIRQYDLNELVTRTWGVFILSK